MENILQDTDHLIREILRIVRNIEQEIHIDPQNKKKIEYLNNLLSAKGSVSVRINKAAYDKAKTICEKTGISINGYVSAATALRTYEDEINN